MRYYEVKEKISKAVAVANERTYWVNFDNAEKLPRSQHEGHAQPRQRTVTHDRRGALVYEKGRGEEERAEEGERKKRRRWEERKKSDE
jgi:hypothetical protein